MAAFSWGCVPTEETEEPNPDNPTPPVVDEPVFKLDVKSVEADYVEIAVTSSAEYEIAYALDTEEQLYTAAVLFKAGTIATVKNGDVIRIDENIDQNTAYHFYAVARLDDKNFSEIIDLEFTTKSYQFDELITVVDTYYDGYKIHLTIPEEVKAKGNVIRYTATSLAVYNVNKNGYEGIENLMDAQSVVSNGDPWGNFIKNDSTVIYNAMNEILLDEYGNPVLDVNGNTIDIHNPITPGEPSVFLAGECRWGTFDEMGDVLGYYYGITGSAYVVPLFDPETCEWTGVFQKKEFFAKEPTLCDATVNIDIPEDEIGVVDANIYFTMDEGVERYFYMVLDNQTYNQVVDIYLDGHEEWFQWFLTSFIAFYEWGIGAVTENIEINAASSFVEPLIGGEKYHVVCTVMGDPAGATQRFIHKEFTTKEKTKRAPVIEIAAVETGDPYEATFNIKAPNSDLVGAYWAINYAREFQLMLNVGQTYESLLKGNYSFTKEEIAAINSAEGLEISVPTLDGEVMRLAVYGFNDEYTFNKIDPDTKGVGWADYKAPMADPATRIESELYEKLAGEWTAVARGKINEQDDSGEVFSRETELKSKITIARNIPNLPDAVEEHVYDLYNGNSREDVDGMFEELKDLADDYAEYRLEGQNRMLCAGFFDYDFYENGRMTYMSPYDLFKAENYSSVDVPQLLYDFGPKWFLQVQSDGSVIVPFSTAYLPPMHSWPGYSFYVGGVNNAGTAFIDAEEASFDKLPGFPVEIVDDNTIKIKPIEREDGVYYMNAIGANGMSYEIIATVVSDIVLTRGWEGSTAAKTSVSALPSKVRGISKTPKAKVYKSVSDFSKIEPVRQYKIEETPNVVTMDMVNKTTEKILNNELR